MNEQQAWDYIEQYILDSKLPYTITLTKYSGNPEYEVKIEATFDEEFGFDVIDTGFGWGKTRLEALLNLIQYTESPDTKAFLIDRQDHYKTMISSEK